mmetsp:Transcript_31908/g.80926  ORF Transcript_31908/g.80926 Transcript_31908/m.80926 type:complete len:139 (+) Transcript_31908:1510-1926(+)
MRTFDVLRFQGGGWRGGSMAPRSLRKELPSEHTGTGNGVLDCSSGGGDISVSQSCTAPRTFGGVTSKPPARPAPSPSLSHIASVRFRFSCRAAMATAAMRSPVEHGCRLWRDGQLAPESTGWPGTHYTGGEGNSQLLA